MKKGMNRMNNTGFNIEVIDSFKKYKGYEGCYIIDYYIRHKHFDSVYASYEDHNDAMDAMNTLDLWEDYQLGYVLEDGSVSFYLDL